MADPHEVMVQFSELLWFVAAGALAMMILCGIAEWLDRRDRRA